MRNLRKFAIALMIGCMLLTGGGLSVFAAGTLSIAVSSGTVATGETMTVTVYAADANNADVTADMNITYDSSKLEYVSSSAGTGGGGTVKATGTAVDIKFKAIASGDAYVKAEGATLTAAGTHINVSGTASSASQTDNDSDASANAAKSGDNSLSSLKISAGILSPAFKPSTTQYSVAVGSDVNELTVTPVTSNSKATVESITGNTNLKSGENVITVLVKAENGTEAAYKITVTKSDTVATSSNGVQKDTDTSDAQDETADTSNETGETADAADTSAAASGAITIGGANYRISEDFTDADIPEGFSGADFEYKGAPYKGISFDHGHLGMYYLVNDTGEGKFFVYDADRDGFYPYVRMSSGEHYIILMVVPNGAIPPDDYEETTLTLPDSTVVTAYRYAGQNEEIVNLEGIESTETAVDQTVSGSDFYIFYGMDDTGVAGWYQYDSKQGTYQRLNGEILGGSDNGENYDTLLKSYNELSDRYKSRKTKDRRLIAVLIFVSVVFLIIIINLILKLRDFGGDDDELTDEKPIRKEKESKPKAVHAPKRRQAPKKEYRKIEEKASDFYEDDDTDTMDEFEEDPSILSKRPKKKEKSVKPHREETVRKEVQKQNVPENEDDDIEFLDLNDL